MNVCDDLAGTVSAAKHRRTLTPYITNSEDALDIGNDSTRVGIIVSEWYALNPDIRRLWVYEAGEMGPDDARDVHVVVALTPVCDSDDISPIWLARCTGWQRHLERLIGRRVQLDWFDGDTELVPCAECSDRARVCLASIAWRECGDEVHR